MSQGRSVVGFGAFSLNRVTSQHEVFGRPCQHDTGLVAADFQLPHSLPVQALFQDQQLSGSIMVPSKATYSSSTLSAEAAKQPGEERGMRHAR